MSLFADRFTDLESLLAPVAGDSAAGTALDGTLELSALELASAEPEDAVVPGVERSDGRNWREIRDRSRALLDRSKDLRVAVLLVRALLQIEGVPGFCAGVGLLCELTQRYWDILHPALDPDEGDALMRTNAIQELVSRPFLEQLRVAPIFGTDRSAKSSVNDLLLATSHPLGRPELSQAPPHIVFGVLDAIGPSVLQEHVALLGATCERLAALVEFVFGKTGSRLQLGAILKLETKGTPGLLDGLHQALAAETARLAKSEAPPAAAGATNGAAEPRLDGAGEISRREDVITMIERICGYYARVEPSSPVPLLLQRAKRLVTMDFLDIVRDLADRGLPQVGIVAGIAIPNLAAAASDEEGDEG